MEKTPFANADEYINAQTANVRTMLKKIRQTIKTAAPEAEEVISYNMPAYKYYGMLVFFAAFKNHIGFYPAPRGIEAFKKELAAYKGAKGSVQFPLDKPIPLDLISKIVKFRMKENKKKDLAKKSSPGNSKKKPLKA
jgi:uncharacterized protein YdhG (YjbR/CyaY superfamily)